MDPEKTSVGILVRKWPITQGGGGGGLKSGFPSYIINGQPLSHNFGKNTGSGVSTPSGCQSGGTWILGECGGFFWMCSAPWRRWFQDAILRHSRGAAGSRYLNNSPAASPQLAGEERVNHLRRFHSRGTVRRAPLGLHCFRMVQFVGQGHSQGMVQCVGQGHSQR